MGLKFTSILVLIALCGQLRAQEKPVYNIELNYDIPIAAASLVLTYYGFDKISKKAKSDSADILALNLSDIIPLNRGAINPFNQVWDIRSNYFFNLSFPYPCLLLLDGDIRKDAPTIGLLYIETMGLTGAGYGNTAGYVNKYRPYTYHPETPFERSLKSGAKNSFFWGSSFGYGRGNFFYG